MDPMEYDVASAKKTFSRIGWALCAILAASVAAQLAVVLIPMLILGPDNFLTSTSTGMWIATFAPTYLIAIPLGLLLFRRIPASAPQSQNLGWKSFMRYIPMAMCLMYAGNIVGTFLSGLLSGGSAENIVVDYAMDNHPLKIIVMVILAPILEEYIFRKQIIDRVCRYGEKTAVLMSAVAFGLFHMNLFQFFYAFALGLLLGYLYIRTGQLRYSVVLHGIINFLGSVVVPFMLSLMDMNALEGLESGVTQEQLAEISGALPGMLLYTLYAYALIALSIAGAVLLIVRNKQALWQRQDEQLPAGTVGKTAYCNPGMVTYIVLCLVFIVLALF